MRDKTMTADEVVSRLESGMTLGIGGWGSRRKPMALVRALLRSPVTDLTVVSYGGPDVGMLAAAGRIRTLVAAFVTLDTIPLEPHYRAARESGALELLEVDEAMFMWGLQAAANRLPFVPVRAGIGSDVMRAAPSLRTVTSPYAGRWPSTVGGAGAVPARQEEFVAMPALRMDAALVHVNRADRLGQRSVPGPRPLLRRPVLRGGRQRLCLVRADRRHRGSDRGCRSADIVDQTSHRHRRGGGPERRALHLLLARPRSGRGSAEALRDHAVAPVRRALPLR
ncbi:acyl CoA:acetate/3-ketoacid CoA transferase alpha subunit [Streptomyces sp. 3212.3]|nr:acyl CoA:acetate/3-ketoacid CoA transferase alpha subunit [Streptomyces sp. 3212.3]